MSNIKVYQPKDFKNRLYGAWIASQLTMSELSRKSGIGASTLYAYMYGDVTPNITYLVALCEILKVSADYLLFGKGEPPKTREVKPKKARPGRVYLTYKGLTLSVTEWSKQLGIPMTTLHYRLKKNLPIEEILKTRK